MENPLPMDKKEVRKLKGEIHKELSGITGKINQAKVCVIAKLVRKMKERNKKLEASPENSKLQNKIDRFLGQISYLKSHNAFQLGTDLLKANKTPNEYISSSESTIEELTIAHVLQFKNIAELIREIRNKLGLDDSTNWDVLIEKFHLGQKRLKPKKKAKKNIDGDSEKKTRKKNKRVQANGNVNKKKPAETADTNENKSDSQNSSTTEEVSKNDIVDNPPTEETTIDPFFITEDGSNYVSTAVASRAETNDKVASGIQDRARESKMTDISKKPKFNKNNNNYSKKQSFNKTPREVKLKTSKSIDVDESVHPSWKAKRKQTGLLDFKGKKVKFGGEDNEVTQTNVNNASTNKDTSDLHPSWVAKQKLKPTITAFKGSKITFDDD